MANGNAVDLAGRRNVWNDERRAKLSASMRASIAAKRKAGLPWPVRKRGPYKKKIRAVRSQGRPSKHTEVQRNTYVMKFERLNAEHQISIAEFARKEGIPVVSLYQWRARFNKQMKRGKNGNTNSTVVHVPTERHQRQERIARIEEPEIDIQHQNQISFAVGHCQSWLTVYAISIEVPAKQFTRRVGELLFRSSHG